MAEEKQVESQNGIEMPEDQAAQPQEDARAVAEQSPGDQPASEDVPGRELVGEKPAGEENLVDNSDVPEEDAKAAMLEDLPKEEAAASPEDVDFGKPKVARAEFQQLSEPAGQPESKNIELLMDINLPVSIELGRTKMSIADILAMGPGSVVELNKLAGEPVDVLVNYKIVAKGEVVVIDENFGVRVTQLMTPEERLKLLGEEE